MSIEKINCPSCGKIFDVGVPTLMRIIMVREKSFWNKLILRKGNLCHSKCSFCGVQVSIWLKEMSVMQHNLLHHGNVRYSNEKNDKEK